MSSRPITFSLSARLLLLTIGFVMLAEVAIFVPSLARYRLDYLNDKLATAHLVMTALDATPEKSTEEIDPLLRDNLLSQGRMLGLTVTRPGMPVRTLGPAIPSRIPHVYDLRQDMFWDLIGDAFATMFRRDYAVSVIGISPANPAVVVEVVFDERPLREGMWAYAGRIFILSIFISVSTAALVYAAIQWLTVRPLRRLTASMTGFQNAPEDPRSVIQPSSRTDEVGVAEKTLASMQQELRSALLQKERLAGVGTAVTKISHDLKNILATAVLESDRLEAMPDPEVKRLAAGMVRAVDRAVTLSATTLRFAKEGLPEVKKQPLRARAVLGDWVAVYQPTLPACAIVIAAGIDFVFDGDPDLLQRALENLLRNAAEAGATAITLTLAQDGGNFVVRVTDNG
ncbi:MAG: HAMP domain-containing histidine kinase, partial [Rhodospirillaceae bacterium]|nr:HAMP domain-containing histidine kinase [Rhodospirillaceae bacterium]